MTSIIIALQPSIDVFVKRQFSYQIPPNPSQLIERRLLLFQTHQNMYNIHCEMQYTEETQPSDNLRDACHFYWEHCINADVNIDTVIDAMKETGAGPRALKQIAAYHEKEQFKRRLL